MAISLVERAKERFGAVRARRPLVDHLVRTVQRYIEAEGPAHAGNVTYFGFLSFFPLLALGFATVGVISTVYPDAQDALVMALKDVFPGIIGEGDGQISVETFQGAAGTAGAVGVAGLLYSGLRWLGALRRGLEDVFGLPPQETPSVVVGKLRDLVTLAVVGLVLIISVVTSTTVTGFSEQLRNALNLDAVPGTGLGVTVIGVGIGVVASTILFTALFTLLAGPDMPRNALRSGALFSALGFEGLKLVAGQLIALSTGGGAAAVFGTALVLVIWISYFARVTLLGASFAETSPLTVAARAKESESDALQEAERMLQVRWGPSAPEEASVERPEEVVTMLRSAAAFAAITMLLRRGFRD
jgi:membrane protein